MEVECEVEAVGRQLVGGRGIGRWVGCRRRPGYSLRRLRRHARVVRSHHRRDRRVGVVFLGWRY